MVNVFISASHKIRKELPQEVNTILETLSELNIEAVLFTEKYKIELILEQQLMKQTMTDIDKCDLFIAETSVNEIGIGMEAGYAKARGKKLIYLRQKKAAHSTAISGISDFHIIYDDCNALKEKLKSVVGNLSKDIRKKRKAFIGSNGLSKKNVLV